MLGTRSPPRRFLFVLAVAGVLSTLAAGVSREGDPPAATRDPKPSTVHSGPTGPPAGLTRRDWNQIQRAVQKSDYHANPVPGAGGPAIHASNRQQRYRTTFRPEGIEIVPQPPAAGSWRLGLSVTGYGYEGDLEPPEAAEPQAQKDRVEYRRGRLTEWYVNRPGGLEQGFVLEKPLSRRAGPLVVAMAVQGDLDVVRGCLACSDRAVGLSMSFVGYRLQTSPRPNNVKQERQV